jgi:hypothetical protein
VVIDINQIAALADAAERARASHEALRALDLQRGELVAIRRGAVRELRQAGWSWQAVALLLGVHRNRAAHLLDP